MEKTKSRMGQQLSDKTNQKLDAFALPYNPFCLYNGRLLLIFVFPFEI